MGYDASKLSLVTQAIAGQRSFEYVDTGGESASTYEGAGYFANAKSVGARAGDQLFVYNKATNDVFRGAFSAVQDTGGTTGTAVLDTGPNYA